jgi:membrane protein required for colicin V production
LNIVDVIILLLLGLPAFFGLKKGLLKSIFSLTSIILGIYLATRFNSNIGYILNHFIKDQKLANLVSFIIIIAFVYLVGSYIAKKLSGINSFTKTIDKFFGLIFGFLKGLILVSLLSLFFKSYDILPQKELKDSVLYPYVSQVSPYTYDFFNKLFSGSAKSFFDKNSFLVKDSTIVK